MSFAEAHKLWNAGNAPPVDEQRIPVETFNVTDVLGRMQATLEEILAVQRHLLAALGSSSDSRSSVEVKTSTRGVDIASKCYANSSMDDLSERAVAEYFATLEAVQRRLTAANA